VLDRADAALAFARLVVVAAMAAAAALVLRSQRGVVDAHAPVWPWVGLALVDLLAFVPPTTAGVPAAALDAPVAAVTRARDAAATDDGGGRIIATTAAVPAQLATRYRADDARAAGGMLPARYRAWLDAVGATADRVRPDRLDAPALRIAAAKYAVASGAGVPASWKPIGEVAGLRIAETPDALPRAWVVDRAELLASPADVFARLRDAAPGDARDVALVDAELMNRHAATGTEGDGWWKRTGRSKRAAEVTYERRTPEEVRVHLRGARGGWLIVADAFAPGWRASTRSRELPIAPAFGLLRAVPLLPGTSEVVFRYRPAAFRYGLFVSAGGAAVWLIVVGLALLSPNDATPGTRFTGPGTA
jgi:hypothetical protein